MNFPAGFASMANFSPAAVAANLQHFRSQYGGSAN